MALAALVPAFTAISAGATALGAGASFLGQRAQASYAEKVANQNADFQRRLGERNAQLVDIEGAAAASALKRDRMRRLGAARASAGASGTTFSGSLMDVYADDAAQYSRDAQYLDYNTAVKRQDALLGGQVATRRELLDAANAQIGGRNAFGTLIGGFGQAAAIGMGVFS